MRKETLIVRALSAEGKQRLARDFSRAVQEAINGVSGLLPCIVARCSNVQNSR